MQDIPPKDAAPRMTEKRMENSHGSFAILAEPLVSSFTAIIRLPMQPEGGRICSRIPESREKSRIYPPNFVTVSKPFMIEVSKSSGKGTSDTSFFVEGSEASAG